MLGLFGYSNIYPVSVALPYFFLSHKLRNIALLALLAWKATYRFSPHLSRKERDILFLVLMTALVEVARQVHCGTDLVFFTAVTKLNRIWTGQLSSALWVGLTSYTSLFCWQKDSRKEEYYLRFMHDLKTQTYDVLSNLIISLKSCVALRKLRTLHTADVFLRK